MLELNKWFFVLAINFFVLFVILNIVLFKPLLKIFTEREDTVKGALDTAKEMSGKHKEEREFNFEDFIFKKVEKKTTKI